MTSISESEIKKELEVTLNLRAKVKDIVENIDTIPQIDKEAAEVVKANWSPEVEDLYVEMVVDNVIQQTGLQDIADWLQTKKVEYNIAQGMFSGAEEFTVYLFKDLEGTVQ